MRVERLHGAAHVTADYVSGAAFHYDPFRDRSFDAKVRDAAADERTLPVRFGAYTDDDELIATVMIHDLPRFIWGQPLGMGGIGGVATMPHARRGGAIRRIFAEATPYMYDHGMALATLYPFSTAFYRKFGYESFHARAFWRLNLWELEIRVPHPEGRWHLIGGFHQDAEALRIDQFIEVTEIAEARHPFGGKRPREVWVKRLTEATARGGKVFALVFTDRTDTPIAALRYETAADRFIVHESGWTGPEGLRALLHYLKGVSGERGAAEVRWPADVPIELYITELAGEAAKCTRRKDAMLTVVHCEAFLGHMAAHATELWRELGGTPLTVAVYDPHEPRNTGYYTVAEGQPVERLGIAAEGREDLALKLGVRGKHPDLYAAPAGLGLLLLGLEPAEALRDLGLIDYADRTAARWARIRPESAWLIDGF